MKTIVIFFSLEGNTKFISETIAKELQADLFELKTKKAFPTSGFGKYFWGGKSVVLKEQPELEKGKIDLSAYDNIIFGSPIWAGTYASPFNTFIKQNEIKGKKIALFACSGSGDTGKCFNMFKEAYKDNQFIADISFRDPLKNDKDINEEKAARWAQNLDF